MYPTSPGSTLDSSPGTLPTPPCATSRFTPVGTAAPEKRWASPRWVHDAQALLTLYDAPDCRRRYAEGPSDAPLADSAGHHLDDCGLLLLGQPARSAQLLAVRLHLLQTRHGTAANGHQFLVGHPGGEACQSIAKNDSGESGSASRHWARTVRYRPGCESSPRVVAGRGCCPWCPASAARCGRWTPQPRCRPGPAGSPESANPAGCWSRRSRRCRRPDRCQKAPPRRPATAGVGFPGRCPTDRRFWGGWCVLRYAFVTHT